MVLANGDHALAVGRWDATVAAAAERVIGRRVPDTSVVVDERAFERLYAAHADQLFTFACRRLPRSDAEDLVADVFLVAWRRRAEMPADPFPWLLGVARMVLANRWRGQQRAAALIDRLKAEATVADGSQSAGELDLEILTALASLDERDQELLLLDAWEELDRRQLAGVFGVSAGTAAVRLFRARRRLARALARGDGERQTDKPSPTLKEVRDA
jgi:RNA polymerase sigma-70 factor (ECF subfamily)